MADSGNAFDFKLFKRLLAFTNAYRGVFYFVAFAAVAMSGLAILRPYLLKRAIDESIVPKDSEGFVFNLLLFFTRTGWAKVLLKI